MKNKNMLWILLCLCIQSCFCMQQHNLDLDSFTQEIVVAPKEHFLVEGCPLALDFHVTWFDSVSMALNMKFLIFNINTPLEIDSILKAKGFNSTETVEKTQSLCEKLNYFIVLNELKVKTEYQGKTLGKQAFEHFEEALKGHFPQSAMMWMAASDDFSKLKDLVKFYKNRGGIILQEFQETTLFYKDFSLFDISEIDCEKNKLYKYISGIKK